MVRLALQNYKMPQRKVILKIKTIKQRFPPCLEVPSCVNSYFPPQVIKSNHNS